MLFRVTVSLERVVEAVEMDDAVSEIFSELETIKPHDFEWKCEEEPTSYDGPIYLGDQRGWEPL